DGRTLATASDVNDDRTVRLWDPATGKPLRTLAGHAQGSWALAFSPDGERLASGDREGVVRIWDVAEGKTRHVLKGHTSGVQGLAFSPDGKALASSGLDGKLRLWDPAAGKETRALTTTSGALFSSLAFSPDGKRLAVGNEEALKVWEVGSLRELFSAPTP